MKRRRRAMPNAPSTVARSAMEVGSGTPGILPAAISVICGRKSCSWTVYRVTICGLLLSCSSCGCSRRCFTGRRRKSLSSIPRIRDSKVSNSFTYYFFFNELAMAQEVLGGLEVSVYS